jgi:Winged helix-turn-helix DNA-binding
MQNTPDHADVERNGWRRSLSGAPPSKAAPDWALDRQALGWSPMLGQVHHVDQTWVRQINRALVLACIRECGPISRVKIVERTALSRATVSTITQALLHEGVIREGRHVPPTSRGGRPAVLLHAM